MAIGVPGEVHAGSTGAVEVFFGVAGSGLTVVGAQVFYASDFGQGSGLGDSLAWGDFNGDGFGDLAIGGGGFVLVLRGSSSGLTTANFQVKAFPGPVPFFALAAGNFNSDTRSDLAVGTPFEGVLVDTRFGTIASGAGVVRVFYGSSSGLNLASPQVWNQFSLNTSDGPETGDLFGAALAAGDFNGDSVSDLAIGVPGEDLLTLGDAGAVNVIYGSSSGLTATGNQFWHQASPGIQGTAQSGDQFGAALAAGDFDGFGGFADLAVGVPFEDFNDSTPDSGAVNVIYGSSGGLSTSTIPASQFLHQNVSGIADTAETGDSFGKALTAWDFNGDAVADLAIGVPLEDVINLNGINTKDAGQVQVLYGSRRITTCCPLFFSPGGLTTVGDQIWHQDVAGIVGLVEAGDQFGSALY